jgi:hypothetical protein
MGRSEKSGLFFVAFEITWALVVENKAPNH